MPELAGHELFVQSIPEWAGYIPDECLLIAIVDEHERVREVVLVEPDADQRYFTALSPELARRGAHSLAFVSVSADSTGLFVRAAAALTCRSTSWSACRLTNPALRWLS